MKKRIVSPVLVYVMLLFSFYKANIPNDNLISLTLSNIDITIELGNNESRYWMEVMLTMARERFQTLTEQMFYILLCLREECCGTDIMAKVKQLSDGRVMVGPGTLYNLLENFVLADLIVETKVEGRKRSYIITEAGQQALADEVQRLKCLIHDYQKPII